jgi:hypothetical protein
MIKKLAAITIIIGLGACSDAPTAERVLRENGYTDIKTTGYDFFACGKGDNFSTGFTATSPNGHKVSGSVCSGLLKGATIRFN